MEKVFMPKAWIKRNYERVVKIGYCDAYWLLHGETPFAYHSGVYGWNCDFYRVHDSKGNIVCISTGYRPMGEQFPTDIAPLEQEAKNIWNGEETFNEKSEKCAQLLAGALK